MDKKDLHTNNLSPKQIEELRRKNPDIVIPDVDLKIDSMNSLLDKAIIPKTLKEIKKELDIKDVDLAVMFGYKNVMSYRNSDGKPKLDSGLEKFYALIKKSE